MTTSNCQVVVLGKILPDADRSQVLSRMQARLKITAAQAEKLVSGKPIILKKELDEQTAAQMVRALTKIGLACRWEPQPEAPLQLQMEKDAPAPPKASLSRANPSKVGACPKCSHPFGEVQVTECPACGIIVDKYLTMQSEPQADTPPEQPMQPVQPAQSETPAQPQGHVLPPLEKQPAPWLLRATAGFASLVVTSAIFNVLALLVAAFFYMKYFKYLSNPVESLSAYNKVLDIIKTYEDITGIIALVIVILYFWVGPVRKGGTWVQRFADLSVLYTASENKPRILAWFLRMLGSLITVIGVMVAIALWGGLMVAPFFVFRGKNPLPGTLGALVVFGVGIYALVLLIRRMKARNPRSLADIFSRTRQMRAQSVAGMGMTGLWIMIVVVGLVSSGTGTWGRKLMVPPTRAEMDARVGEAQFDQDVAVLARLDEMEQQYLEAYDTYTDQFDLLFDDFASTKSLRDGTLMKAALDGRLEITLTESGYRAALRIRGSSGRVHVQTEAGYQGIKSK